MERGSINDRFISPEEASALFAMQMKLFPEIADRVTALSGGSLGVVNAIMITMGEKISEEPDVRVTPEFVATSLGAPEDMSGLDQWRQGFWDDFKSRAEPSD